MNQSASDNPEQVPFHHPRRLMEFLPPTVIKSWFNDEYFIGTGSRAAYYDLGTMLMLRGIYWYSVIAEHRTKPTGPVAMGGCFYIDIENDELSFNGVRLYTNPDWHDKEADQEIGRSFLRPWRSIVAKLIRPTEPSSAGRNLALLVQLCETDRVAEARRILEADKLPDFNKWSENETWKVCFLGEEPKRANSRAESEHFVRKLISRLLDAAPDLAQVYRDEPVKGPQHAAWLEIRPSREAASGPTTVIEGRYATVVANSPEPNTGDLRFERLVPEGGIE